jgi:DNA-binding NarL/FixJ family response regulator
VVVDDSLTFRELVCTLLETGDSIKVIGRGQDGADAIDIVARLAPDVLLMDVNMPNLDGITSAMLICTRHPGTQIILMSAEDSPELRHRCHCSGAVRFVCKSNLSQTLPGALRSLLTLETSE